ncbi:MAG: acyl carrier protein [Verrucomicrobia bacterium]|nr:MAG: acyl carrier protein [Verrucomicrobiota bacterium]
MSSESSSPLRAQLKSQLVETLMLQVAAAEIGDDQPLFGPEGLGLDSVDALQLVVMLDKHHGLKVTDTEVAQQVLRSVSTMASAIERHRATAASDVAERPAHD